MFDFSVTGEFFGVEIFQMSEFQPERFQNVSIRALNKVMLS